MSSATSIKELPPEGGSSEDGFNVGHLFVLLSLLAATTAVVMARPSTPESLILISVTIGAAGFAALCLYRVLAPLVAPASALEQEPISERLRADLEREKALTLRSIKELEFDRAMQKLSQQDFDQMAARLRARAIGIIKQLDAGTSNYRERIERDLAARVVTTSKPELQLGRAASKPPAGTSTPDLPASAKATAGPPKLSEGGKVGPAGASALCACGTSNDPDARFCKNCGTKLVTV
jgi:hypothetical protein